MPLEQKASARGVITLNEFKKLTHDFEKAVIDATTVGDPNLIPGLLEQYNADVRALDFTR